MRAIRIVQEAIIISQVTKQDLLTQQGTVIFLLAIWQDEIIQRVILIILWENRLVFLPQLEVQTFLKEFRPVIIIPQEHRTIFQDFRQAISVLPGTKII